MGIITSGAAIVQAEATPTTVVSDSSAIADGDINAGTAGLVEPSDIVDFGDAVLDVQFSVAPDVGGVFKVFRRDLDISGSNHAEIPSALIQHIWMGNFPVAAITTRQYIALPRIPLSQKQEFYILNSCGQSTTGTTVVTVTPKTYNSKA